MQNSAFAHLDLAAARTRLATVATLEWAAQQRVADWEATPERIRAYFDPQEVFGPDARLALRELREEADALEDYINELEGEA